MNVFFSLSHTHTAHPPAGESHSHIGPFVTSFYAALAALDATALAKHFTEDVAFTFANMPTVSGRAAAEAFNAGFFSMIASMNHVVHDAWRVVDAKGTHTLIAEGTATATRKDGSSITVPFMDVFRMNGELACDVRAHSDTSALFPAAAHAK